ncbi:MAG: ABC transporter permease [Alphaproteobacteria bacterium]|nr:ABC transporter permease [Alphaproteobacteria bacterium]
MKNSAILGEALISMRSTGLRTFLTMLGIIIGVGSVVLMLAIGRGVEISVRDSIASQGANLFIILSGSTTASGIRTGSGGAATLTVGDAQELAGLPGVVAVSPNVAGISQIVNEGQNWSTQVRGATADFFIIRDWTVSAGALFDDGAERAAAPVAVIGATVAENLFLSDEDPVGRTIRIKNIPFQVVGVLEKKGQSVDGQDQDDTIVVPLTTAQRRLFGSPFPGAVRVIFVQAASEEAMKGLDEKIREVLRLRHRLGENQDDDFTVRDLTAIGQTIQESTQAIALLLGSIAAISLVVGGIGIMNIMLVSVTERTREIGVRKAIGARERDILLQFLIESVILSLGGGLIGLLLGGGLSMLIGSIFNLPTEVSLFSVTLSFVVAAGIGVFFGYYPARQAARLQPIEALRYQ